MLEKLWERRRGAWERRFVLRNGQPWVVKTEGGLGCLVCKATDGGNWAKGTVGAAQARASVLRRHQESQQHKVRETAYLGQDLGPTGVCMAGAPCLLKLKEVLHGLQRGKSEREEGRGSKVAELRWAIAEAYASLDLEFLGKATSVALCRDERHGKLLVRFSAATEDLEHRSGTIALVKLNGCTAFDLVVATRKALTFFCTCGHPPKLNRKLFDWIRTHVEVIANDAASNEMLAGDVGRGRRVWNDELLDACDWAAGMPGRALDGCDSAGMPGSALDNRDPNADGDKFLTPNLLLVHRDHAHCARRVLVRPWKADEELERLMTEHILGGDSVVQLVHRSPVLSCWFQKFIDAEEESLPKVHGLRAAKHRFETSATPLGRFCIHLVSLLRLARKVVVLRKDGDAAAKFVSWLRSLHGDDLVQLAMLADACDEALGVVRALDTETADIAALPRVMGEFLERVQFLFESQWCRNPASEGFTAHVLRLIESGAVQVESPDQRGSRVLTVSPSAIERACARMQVWVVLARKTVHAEFPNFDLFNAFSIFDLREGANISDDNAAVLPLVGKSVRRLAQAFHVDPDDLSAQIERHKPRATNIQQSRNCGNQEAWLEALAQAQRTAHGRQFYPSTALRPVLRRYVAWVGGTSGVEQRFSQLDYYHDDHASPHPANESKKTRNLAVMFDIRPAEEDWICERARELLATGRQRRQHQHPRLDSGTTRRRELLPQSKLADSEASWLRRRRARLGDALRSAAAARLRQTSSEVPWSDGHARETSFLEAKLKRRRVEALDDGVLLPEEVDEKLLADADAQHKKRQTRGSQEGCCANTVACNRRRRDPLASLGHDQREVRLVARRCRVAGDC